MTGSFCNDSAAQFWQKDALRMLGKQSTDLFHLDFMIQRKISSVLETGKVFRMGTCIPKTSPLQKRGAEIVIATVRNKSGRAHLAIITLLGSTIYQESQAREREEQLSRSLWTLAASL